MRMTVVPSVLAAPVYSSTGQAVPATVADDTRTQDKIEDAPFFADGVLSRARATQARLEAANFAKVNEPIVFARAIREVYENQELVKIVERSLAELTKHRGYPMVYCFRGIGLVLTQDGFRDLNGNPIGKTLNMGDHKMAASARQQVDAQLVLLADTPDTMAEFLPGRMRRTDSSSSIEQCQEQHRPACGKHPAQAADQSQQTQQAARPRKRKGIAARSLGHLPVVGRLFR
jgi:hypothetical protein